MDYTPEVVCIAQTVHGEARGESLAGKEAVAQVILNRMKKTGNSACRVVKAKGQFYGYYRGLKPDKVSLSVANRALLGQLINRIGKRLYFNTVGPAKAMRIGNHKFW